MIRLSVLLALWLVFSISSVGLGKEKPHAVLVVGTHHYSPQTTLPDFADELGRLGFEVTLLNPDWDPEKDKRGIPGLEALKEADVAVFFTRFLKLGDEQLAHITDYVESGKPVVGLRTSNHGFNYPKGDPNAEWNTRFGKEVLGSPYLIHLQSGTEFKLAPGAEEHPILTGVDPKNWKSPGTLYLTDLAPDAKPLVLGTGSPREKEPTVRKNDFGSHALEPVMTDTIAWTWTNQWDGRVFSTSLGHAVDFSDPSSMRVLVNGVFWAADQPIPSADTEINVRDASSKKKTAKKASPKVENGASGAGLTLLYGNSLVERLQEDGTFEGLMHAADPQAQLRFRSMAYTGDEVGFRIRPAKFGDHLGFVTEKLPCDRVVMCFGQNESFAGAEGLALFEKNLLSYLDLIERRHQNAEFVLVAPTAVEEAGEGFPDAAQRNADIALYSETMKKIAEERGITFVDLFSSSQKLFSESEARLTSNGLHLNASGLRLIGKELAAVMGAEPKVDLNSAGFDTLTKLVSRKAYEVAMAYKPANGIHYYGLRARDYEYDVEIPHHLVLADKLDEAIWAQSKNLERALDFPELPTVSANPPPKRPRKGLGVIRTTEEDLTDFTVADGFEVDVFASSENFPNLINPLQVHFDGKGRLWVCTFESYPVPLPGDLSDDKILIYEDTDGDGKADKETVFAEGLKLPDGFVFYKDGVVVSVARKLVWLRDTDGDDVADVEQEMLRGADDTDTHHGGYLARTPQGDIILNEALFHRGQFETPHGLVRTKNAAALFFDPESEKLSIQRQTTHPNPWKITYNTKGEALQMFGGGQIIDCDFYDVATPVGVSSSATMGMPFRDDKGFTISWVVGDHFPDSMYGGVVTGHLLGKNAVLYTPLKYGVGGDYVAAGKRENLLSSSNKSFRPSDLVFGYDGALYVSDFYYPIIGHAQHSIRDANRDYENGRIWRVTKKGADLKEVPVIAGAALPELFELLMNAHPNIREAARYEIERHPDEEVLAFAKSQVDAAKANEELGIELLWLFERLEDHSEPELFFQLVGSENLEIRRVAVKSLREWEAVSQERVRQVATTLAAGDDVRTQMSLVSAASYLQSKEDPFWNDLISSIDAEEETSIAKMKALAALFDSPALSPEFPLLKVAPDCTVTGWQATEKEFGGVLVFESDREQTVTLGYRENPYINLDANNIPILRATGSQHSKDGQISLDLNEGKNKIEYFSEQRGKPMKGKIDIYIADLVGEKPSGVRYPEDADELQAWVDEYFENNATVTDAQIRVKTIPSQMAFNVESFTVVAGQSYQFVFENLDHMLHNLLITKSGKAGAVGELADAMAAQPDAMEKHFIPESEDVLFSTKQIPYGEKVELEFQAPEKPGRYPFICTFPGHWRMMKGVMIVE